MKETKRRFGWLLIVILFGSWGFGNEGSAIQAEPLGALVADADQAEAQKVTEAPWRTGAISEDIVWKFHHFEELFSSRQFISILEVDLSGERVRVDFLHPESGFLNTSDGGREAGATATINGSYFNMSTGKNVIFFRNKGELISDTIEDFPFDRDNAGLAVDKNEQISIIRRPPSGWGSSTVFSVLTSGPLLISGKEILDQKNLRFNTNRHPRTAVGLTADNRLISVVVDGRTAQSQGMSLKELSIVMEALGCVDAMNLDGGGSSTMWIENRGIVNHPCDNKQFDHAGERAVATIVSFTQNSD